MASETGTLYTGVTNNLYRRVWEHKKKLIKGFTEKYNCYKLIHLEEYQDINQAIHREKEIKKWRREKKENLIRLNNPAWKDLSKGWYEDDN